MRADAPDVRVTAGRVDTEWRVLFRHEGPVTPSGPARVECERLAQAGVTHSPDLRAVAIEAWEDPGTITVHWPDGRRARWMGGSHLDRTVVAYRLLDEPDGVRVSALLPHAVPMTGLLGVLVEGLPDAGGVRASGLVRGPGGAVAPLTQGMLDPEAGHAWLVLPADERGVLVSGQHRYVLALEDGRELPFLVGIDSDGVLTATGGHAEILGGEG